MPESSHWRPLFWSPERNQSTTKRAYKYAELELYLILGAHAGGIAAAELRARMLEEKSRVLLAAAGVKTIGEVGE